MNSLKKFSQPHSVGRRYLSWVVAFAILVGGYFLATYLTNLQNKVEQATERFTRAVEGSQSGLWEWSDPTPMPNNNPDSHVWYSHRFAELLGYAPSEIVYTRRWFRDKLHPDDEAANQREIATSLKNGTTYSMQLRLKTKEGEYRWFAAKGVPYYDEDGKAIYLSGSMRDINALKVQALRLERLVGSAPVAIILCDEHQLVTEYNREAEKLFGWSRAEMLGRSVDKLMALGEVSHHSDAMGSRVAELRNRDEDVQATKRLIGQARHKSGEEFTAEISLRAYKYGGVIEFAAVIKEAAPNVDPKE